MLPVTCTVKAAEVPFFKLDDCGREGKEALAPLHCILLSVRGEQSTAPRFLTVNMRLPPT